MRQSTYLIAWDISARHRLRQVGEAVKAWKACGQKSVAECWMTGVQRSALITRLDRLIDHETDRLYAIRLDPRCEVMLFGIANRPSATHFVII
jgi:CRISPR/Cas system-associated endoribonuclease Cas2